MVEICSKRLENTHMEYYIYSIQRTAEKTKTAFKQVLYLWHDSHKNSILRTHLKKNPCKQTQIVFKSKIEKKSNSEFPVNTYPCELSGTTRRL